MQKLYMPEHLLSITDNDITILPTDVICSTCYKLHLTLTRSKEQEADSTLKCDVQKWRAQIEEGTDTLTGAVFILLFRTTYGKQGLAFA